jgi:hypothetical protein
MMTPTMMIVAPKNMPNLLPLWKKTAQQNSERSKRIDVRISLPGVQSGADKRNSDDGTNLSHRADDSSFDSNTSNSEKVQEGRVVEQVTEHRGVKTIGGRAEESDD